MIDNNRPLSPHLQIYRPQITSILSIVHRATGFGLAAGAVFVTWWLMAAAHSMEAYGTFYAFAKSFIGQLMLFGWLWAMTYHFLNGLRHLAWDMLIGLNMKAATKSGFAVVGASVILTLIFWFLKG
jgi:succinate dehydrogenase / fumarate reductase cytochrome b subunit